ncbi:MAG: helix-turn-helix transcriptional regulator [Actinoplanes sp.]
MKPTDPLIDQLRERRYQVGGSAYTLSARAGLGYSQLYRAEAGTRSPTLTTLRAWADALDCDIQLVPRSTSTERTAA